MKRMIWIALGWLAMLTSAYADSASLNNSSNLTSAQIRNVTDSRAVFRDCSDCPEMVVIPARKLRDGIAT